MKFMLKQTLPIVIVGGGGRQILENSKLGGYNKLGWVEKSWRKSSNLPKNLHEFERIRAIWENILESFKIIFQIS